MAETGFVTTELGINRKAITLLSIKQTIRVIVTGTYRIKNHENREATILSRSRQIFIW
jgi:hypothetical protein